MNLYKCYAIDEDDNKECVEFSTENSMVNARIRDLIDDTDLEHMSFDMRAEVKLFSWGWIDIGSQKFEAFAQCDDLDDETTKLIRGYD